MGNEVFYIQLLILCKIKILVTKKNTWIFQLYLSNYSLKNNNVPWLNYTATNVIIESNKNNKT